MTIQAAPNPAGGPARPADGISVTIDGFEITVPKGTLVIRAAEQLGIQIPQFCDHPLLDPVGACRQCLVHIEGQPKPPASCTTACTDGMVVHTQLTSPVAEKAQRGVMEMLLVNHPLDCPMCDKGGECPVQNCPVGALTGASYRFRARPFDLVSTPSVCEHCAAGCRQRTDHRRGVITRRLAGHDPQVNEEWNCDKGRWAFTYATQPDRLATPLVRDEAGVLVPASWPEAIGIAARGLTAARGKAGVLAGGRLTLEDSYAYAKFARLALGSNDIDMRARPHSAEEAQFLASHVAGRGGVSYRSLQQAPAVLRGVFEPGDEPPIVFPRLRK